MRVVKPPSPYEQQHRALPDDRKWCLPGGRFVEDVLFTWAVSRGENLKVPRESYAHSYILDVDDPVIKSLFTTEEWDTIVSLVLPLPMVDVSLALYMHKFADVKTTTDLRHRLIATPYIPPGEVYSSDKHGHQAWFHLVLSSLTVLYEFDHMSRTDYLEAWFQMNIWGPIFDRCFQHIPKMSIIRSESQSPANSDRKNLGDADRKPIGKRYDGLVVHDKIEYGAVEDGRQFQGDKSKRWTSGEKSKKWISDSLKLVKLLHDQMRGLEGKVKHDKEALAGFQCVGFLTAGLNCQSLYLQYGKGNICVLKRSEILEVPTNISPLSSLIAVLVLVWAMREVVRNSVANLEAFLGNTEVQFRAAVDQTAHILAILPTCFDTDTEI